MLPLRAVRKYPKYPIVSLLLVLANIAVFLIPFFKPISPVEMIQQYGFVPRAFSQGQLPWWRLVSAIFVHGGFSHLSGNMLFLWVFSPAIENRLGRIRFLLFYLLVGAAATLAHAVMHFNELVPMVGASGAVSGVLGAYIIFYPLSPIRTLVFYIFFVRIVDIPAMVFIGLWFLMQIFYTLSGVPGVAWYAHLGGFIMGIILGKYLGPPKKTQRRRGGTDVNFRVIS